MGSVNTYDPTTGQLRRIVGDDNHLRDEMVAEYEPNSTASHAYSKGDQFLYNEVLYTATKNIAIGDDIVPGNVPELVGILSISNDVSKIVKIKVDNTEYTSFDNIPIYGNSVIALYQAEYKGWIYTLDDSMMHMIGTDYVCHFYVPSQASGSGTVYVEDEGGDTKLNFYLSEGWASNVTAVNLGEGTTTNPNCTPSLSITEQLANTSTADNFIGTREQWAALTPEEQAKYNTMDFLGDSSSGGGGLNPDIVAPTEYSPSLHSYTIGDQLIYDDELYTVTNPIAVGDELGTTGGEPNAWAEKTWNGLSSFAGKYIWTDGENIYYSYGDHYVLDKTISAWFPKSWSGESIYSGEAIWTDGENWYYGCDFILDKATSTWIYRKWNGAWEEGWGNSVWTDGNNYYYSYGTYQYLLHPDTLNSEIWQWEGLSSIYGEQIWTDGDHIYYSNGADQYVLNGIVWEQKTWNGSNAIYGKYVWTDGANIYYSYNGTNLILDKSTSTWSEKTWDGVDNIDGSNIWTDGEDTYYSSSTVQCRLVKSGGNIQPSPTIVKQIEFSGHTIVDEEGTELTQRSKLQFKGAVVLDDSENNATVVDIDPTLRDAEVIEGKNLLNPDNYAPSGTESYGVTYIVNADGSVTANGVADSSHTSGFPLLIGEGSDLQWLNGKKINGCTGGSVNTFSINVVLAQSPWTNYLSQTEDDEVISGIPDDTSPIQVLIRVQKSVSVNNKIFYPMISVDGGEYEPFYIPVKDAMLRRSEQRVLGAKNLIPYPYADGESLTDNGITYTVNADGSITANGTATATSHFYMRSYGKVPFELKAGTYKLNGCPTGGGQSIYAIRYNYSTGGSGIIAAQDNGEGAIFTLNVDRELSGVYLIIWQGVTVNNLTFKPMLRLASDPDDTFAPYAMTNRELTEAVADSGWVTPTFATNFSGDVEYRQIGKLVILRGYIKGTTTGDSLSALTGLPAASRSSFATGIGGSDGKSISNNSVYISKNATTMKMHVKAANENLYFTLTYFAA